MKISTSTLSSIKTLAIIILALFIILYILEVKAYYFPNGKFQNTNSNNLNNKKQREDYINLFQDTEFNNVFEYLEAADAGYESEFKHLDENIGCYDNDTMIEDIKGTGETCKTASLEVQNIYAKDLIHSNGDKYSFAELCPVTSGQERPIMCLYNKGKQITKATQKLSNLIDNVQLEQDTRLQNISKSMNQHTIDPNRLHNTDHVQAYNKYENDMNMGIERRFNIEDQLDDLVNYSNRLKANI